MVRQIDRRRRAVDLDRLAELHALVERHDRVDADDDALVDRARRVEIEHDIVGPGRQLGDLVGAVLVGHRGLAAGGHDDADERLAGVLVDDDALDRAGRDGLRVGGRGYQDRDGGVASSHPSAIRAPVRARQRGTIKPLHTLRATRACLSQYARTP